MLVFFQALWSGHGMPHVAKTDTMPTAQLCPGITESLTLASLANAKRTPPPTRNPGESEADFESRYDDYFVKRLCELENEFPNHGFTSLIKYEQDRRMKSGKQPFTCSRAP